MEDIFINCPKCDARLPQSARFCSTCGKKLGVARSLSPKQWGLFLLITFVVWSTAWVGQGVKSGDRPQGTFTPEGSGEKLSSHGVVSKLETPELKNLRERVEREPNNIDALKALGGTLIGLRVGGDQQSTLEAVDVYRRIVALEPTNREALLTLGDLSFDQKLFNSAVTYYEKFLTNYPDDLVVRARYGSSLTFVNQLEKAEAELRKVLTVKPDDFHANAYLSIVFAQRGNVDDAKTFAAKAVAVAPSEEAKARLNQFVASLSAQGKEREAHAGSESLQPFFNFLKSHPIVGGKFIKGEETGTTVKLFLKDFPMRGMPPFAKEKFFGTIRTNLQGTKIATVEFYDVETSEKMDTIALTPQ